MGKVPTTDLVWKEAHMFRTNWSIDEIETHEEGTCAGEFCSVHNPSDHPLKDAPLNWRSDRRIMERICPHGIGHDDPDDLAYRKKVGRESSGIHGCDGCCRANIPPVEEYLVTLDELIPINVKWKHVPKGKTIEPNTPFLYIGLTATTWYREGMKFPHTVGVDDLYYVPAKE